MLRGIGRLRAGGGGFGFTDTKALIEADSGDVNILVIGDSTGNETTEWVYLFGEWLGEQYPTHSVSYRVWDNTGKVYESAIAISTGSGANTIRIWNASVAGSGPMLFVGTGGEDAVDAVSTDLVIESHGHNIILPTIEATRSQIYTGVEYVRLAHPNARYAFFKQNPKRDDDTMAPIVEEWAQLALKYGDVAIIDAYSRFIAQNKDSSLYTDNTHPNAAGEQLFLEALQYEWNRSTGNRPVRGASLSQTGTNLLTGADFFNAGSYSGGAPTGWTIGSSATCTADAVTFDSGRSQSMKMVGTTANGRITQTISAGGLTAAKSAGAVTLAVRRYAPTGSPTSVGRVAVAVTDGATTVYTTTSTTQTHGRWCWVVMSARVPSTATAVIVNLYCDTSANVSSEVYYDEAVLVAGDMPLDA